MTQIPYLDANGVTRYLKARGDGSELDPFIPIRDVADEPLSYVETQLTAPGTTTSRDARGYQYLQFLLTVANIDSSILVVPETSNNGTNWYPLGEPYIITSNGTDIIGFSYAQPLGFVRLHWVSELGGTSATLDVITVIQ
jgi:hypothetical protein